MTDTWPEDTFKDLFSRIGLRPFEVFYHVVELGSFSRAAEELNLSQPTVSQHVKNLEETLDEPLLRRDQSEMTLTEVGEICFEKLKELQAVKADLEDELRSYSQSGRRELTVGASTIPGEFLLPQILSEFRELHDEITIRIEIDESSTVLEQIEAGDLRWGLVGSRPDRSTLEPEPMIVEPMRLVSAPGLFEGTSDLSLEDLEEIPYVGRRACSGTRRAVEGFFRNHGLDPSGALNTVARLGTVQAVREAVLNGLGISFLPDSAVRRDLRTDRLRTLSTNFGPIERTFFGVHNRFLGVSPVIETFRDFLNEHESLRRAE